MLAISLLEVFFQSNVFLDCYPPQMILPNRSPEMGGLRQKNYKVVVFRPISIGSCTQNLFLIIRPLYFHCLYGYVTVSIIYFFQVTVEFVLGLVLF